MRRHFPVAAIAVLGLVSTGMLATSVTAKAEDSSTKMQDSASDSQHHRHFSEADRAAFLDARVAGLHAGLELTPDQEKLWPPVETALRDFSKLVRTQWQKFHEQKDQHDPIARMRLRSENLIARGQALKKLADAAAPLYAALSDAQKQRLPMLARAVFHPFKHHHHFHHFGERGEWRHGEHRHHHEWRKEGHEDDHDSGDHDRD